MMTEPAILQQTDYRGDFERFRAAREEPDFVSRIRQAGWQRFEQLGFPTRRRGREQWRFSDVSALSRRSLKRAPGVLIDADKLPMVNTESADTILLVFVNGYFNTSLSQLAALPAGIVVCSLGQALQDHSALVETYLEQTPLPEDQPFAALNSAFLEDGVFIHVPAGQSLQQPVHLLYYSTGGNDNNSDLIAYPRNLIVLEREAQATVLEEHCGEGDYLSCPVSELILADGARCDYYKLQQEAAAAFHLGTLRSRQARDTHLSTHLLTVDGLVNRNDILALLDGEGAENIMRGLMLVEDGQYGDNHVRVEHGKAHGSSQQVFKNVLTGKSRAVFDGLIKVVKDAQKTSASQTSRNLLLSKRAVAQANPRLEILADDVKCAHGSTTGFLDRDAVFYLRSRGLPQAQAQALLVYAFANEQLDSIKLDGLHERMQNLLVGRFEPA